MMIKIYEKNFFQVIKKSRKSSIDKQKTTETEWNDQMRIGWLNREKFFWIFSLNGIYIIFVSLIKKKLLLSKFFSFVLFEKQNIPYPIQILPQNNNNVVISCIFVLFWLSKLCKYIQVRKTYIHTQTHNQTI